MNWISVCSGLKIKLIPLQYTFDNIQFSSVQSFSRVQLLATPGIASCQISLSIANARSLLKATSIESVMPSSHLILCRPLVLPPSIFPSIRVFSSNLLYSNQLRFYSSGGQTTGVFTSASVLPMNIPD